MENVYSRMAKPYRPEQIKLLLVAESPPAYDEKETRGEIRYFYNPNYLHPRDSLYRAVVEAVLKQTQITDKSFLESIKSAGIFLLDVCEKPINKYKRRERIRELKDNVGSLVDRMHSLISEGRLSKDTPIALISKNVYKVCYRELKEDNFNVAPNFLYFPSRWRSRFIAQLQDVIHNL